MATYVTNDGVELNAPTLRSGVSFVTNERQQAAADESPEASVNGDGYVEFGPYSVLNVEGHNKNTQVLVFESTNGAIGSNDTVNADGTVTRG